MPKKPEPKVAREDVEAAEKAAQRSVCDIPRGDLPDDLAKALERRVEVSLKASTREVVRAGGADSQVRSLEAPWRKRRPHDADDDQPVKPRKTTKTAAKKTAAKKTAATPAASTENKE